MKNSHANADYGLEVPGYVQLRTENNSRIYIGEKTSGIMGLNFKDDYPVHLQNEVTGGFADIVTGDLTVTDTFLLKPSKAVCTTRNAGAIRRSLDGKLQFCGGSDLKWRTLKDQ